MSHVATAGRLARESVEYCSCDSGGSPYPKRSNGVVPVVLGSLGPLVESYRPDLIMDHDDGVRTYTKTIKALGRYVNAYITETM